MSTSGWRRTGQGASVGCGGADGAWDCGCGAAKVTTPSRTAAEWWQRWSSGEEAEEVKCGECK
jgi:hypothetical protein